MRVAGGDRIRWYLGEPAVCAPSENRTSGNIALRPGAGISRERPGSNSLDELAHSWRNGDERAAEPALRRVAAIARSVATSRYGFLREDADDVAQEICLAVVLRLREIHRLGAWAFAATSYACIDLIRKREIAERGLERYAAGFIEPPVSSFHSSPKERTIDLRRALEELPTPERTILRMRYALGMRWKEIDVALFGGEEQSRHRGHAALARLARRLSRGKPRRPLAPPVWARSAETARIRFAA